LLETIYIAVADNDAASHQDHNPHPPYSAVPQIIGSNQCAVQAPSPPYSVTPQIMEPAVGTQDTTKAINHAY
jgi:hypothetical protein